MLLLGVVLVYLIMVAQFQSLKSPFIVMFTIPLAFTGGFLALLVSGIEVSVVSLIGFGMLVGVIVNNGIVLVDYINQQRQDGMARREAIIDAGVTRLRPILMTSLTTILGLVVTALAKNAGTALIQPIALVCIGGLLYATLMTLFVVPVLYDLFYRKPPVNIDVGDDGMDDLPDDAAEFAAEFAARRAAEGKNQPEPETPDTAEHRRLKLPGKSDTENGEGTPQ